MYIYIYALNVNIINKNTVYTHVCPEDRIKVNLVAWRSLIQIDIFVFISS